MDSMKTLFVRGGRMLAVVLAAGLCVAGCKSERNAGDEKLKRCEYRLDSTGRANAIAIYNLNREVYAKDSLILELFRMLDHRDSVIVAANDSIAVLNEQLADCMARRAKPQKPTKPKQPGNKTVKKPTPRTVCPEQPICNPGPRQNVVSGSDDASAVTSGNINTGTTNIVTKGDNNNINVNNGTIIINNNAPATNGKTDEKKKTVEVTVRRRIIHNYTR